MRAFLPNDQPHALGAAAHYILVGVRLLRLDSVAGERGFLDPGQEDSQCLFRLFVDGFHVVEAARRDNWGRYWHLHPFTEQELRDHVARDGLFPDEHARALLDT
ncbi:hypothetical protein HET64_01435 [Streptomyces sp. McG3]|nr:hypothetical protein [Streptomyces sp. McG3]